MTTTVTQSHRRISREGRAHILQHKEIPRYVTVFRIHGPFLFGATDKIAEITENIGKLPPIVVLRLRNMTAIDATGIAALEELAAQLQASGRTMLICGARPQPAVLMRESRFERHIGIKNICSNIDDALKRAEEIHNLPTSTHEFRQV